jgi:hypothetical protein
LKVSVPCSEPKFVPAIVTEELGLAASGEILLIFGAGIVKLKPLLPVPLLEFTTTFPLFTRAGTVAVMLVSLQVETVAAEPLNVTLPVPRVAPKLVPLMVTAVPAVAVEGVITLTDATGIGVEVTASVDVLNLKVTVWRLPAVFCSTRIATNLSVLAVVAAVVILQLKVLTAAVLRTVLIVPSWQAEVISVPVELTCAKQTSVIRILALAVVLSMTTA